MKTCQSDLLPKYSGPRFSDKVTLPSEGGHTFKLGQLRPHPLDSRTPILPLGPPFPLKLAPQLVQNSTFLRLQEIHALHFSPGP